MGVSLPFHLDRAAHMVFDGLRLQQSRGQDGSGICAWSGCGGFRCHKALGLVPDAIPRAFVEEGASVAIGHNRYATQGPQTEVNLQPNTALCRDGTTMYVASNGDLPNYRELRSAAQQAGAQLATDNDGELLAWFIAKEYDRCGSIVEAIRSVQASVAGAFSALLMHNDQLFAFRDPFGFRPMVMADLPGGGVAFASEEVAFDVLLANSASYREVPAGGIVEAVNGVVTVHSAGIPARAGCIFELIYFARPDGRVFGRPVSLYRRRCGWRLARSARLPELKNAVVVSVPDAANELAAGVADGLRLPLVAGLLRSHTARRTFILSEQAVRDEGVRYKLNPDRWLVNGRDIVLVDDSIVRGTTIHRIVRMLRRAGAASVSLLIGSPPVRWSCYMGIATPTRQELIASHETVAGITARLEVDHLVYLPLEDALEATGPFVSWELEEHAAYLGPRVAELQTDLGTIPTKQFCTACFSGQYQVPVPFVG